VVYLGVTLQITRNLHTSLTETLLTRFEKEALAEQIAAQMAVTQRVSDEKTRFFAAASHDLRQPLHAIALFGAVLERELHEHSSGQSARRLMRAVHAMGSSLDTMLDVSRLDAGVVQPEVVATPLKSTLQILNQMFSSRAEDKGLQLRLRTTPMWVLSDPQLLQRLLANLVENALKYTEQGGVLVVARARDNQVCIDVIDTGVGIAPEHIEQIFDEFYQVDNPGRDRSQGLGIGLSIVRRLSRLLDHPLQIKSRPGMGSRFRLSLPMALPKDAAPRRPSSLASLASGDLSGERPVEHMLPTPALALPALPSPMLLLDDETDIGDAMRDLLASHGVQLEVAVDEVAAEAAFRQAGLRHQTFAALICDYRLAEGADGLQAAHRLRAQFAPDLPLLLVTGETAPHRLQSVRDAGVPVLFKPVVVPLLLQALADLTARP
jgi:CheY-like chemotaxis protein/nitrogen-specific signal transduction histidine kinase